jgi:hypothetical protein
MKLYGFAYGSTKNSSVIIISYFVHMNQEVCKKEYLSKSLLKFFNRITVWLGVTVNPCLFIFYMYIYIHIHIYIYIY